MDSLLALNPTLLQPTALYSPATAAFAAGLAAGRCGAGLPLAGGLAPQGGANLANSLMLNGLLQVLSSMLVDNGLRQSLGLPQNDGGAAAPVNSSSSSNTGGDNNASLASGPIGAGSKVLMIGDSHSAGTFGTELDKQLRSAGAKVDTYAASGSSANNWLNGGTTKSGWVNRKQDGSVDSPPWQQPHQIPKLADLISQHKPDVVIVNLGANFRGDPSQAKALAEVCKKAGTRLIWVGPPKTRQDSSDGGASLKKFDESMKAALAGMGEYISSADLTPNYAGGDGLHYNGAEGSKIATSWADGVARQITGKR